LSYCCMRVTDVLLALPPTSPGHGPSRHLWGRLRQRNGGCGVGSVAALGPHGLRPDLDRYEREAL